MNALQTLQNDLNRNHEQLQQLLHQVLSAFHERRPGSQTTTRSQLRQANRLALELSSNIASQVVRPYLTALGAAWKEQVSLTESYGHFAMKFTIDPASSDWQTRVKSQYEGSISGGKPNGSMDLSNRNEEQRFRAGLEQLLQGLRNMQEHHHNLIRRVDEAIQRVGWQGTTQRNGNPTDVAAQQEEAGLKAIAEMRSTIPVAPRLAAR